MPLKTITDDEPTLNLTPMVDVLFLLIIFFMAGTKFIDAEGKIPLQVPTVGNRDTLSSAPEPKVVSVYQDGQITLGPAEVTPEQLTSKLVVARSQYKELGVLIRGDKSATHGRMTEVYNACRQAGIAELAISVKVDTIKK